jgi:hypothetical protein
VELEGGIFHIENPNKLTFRELFELAGLEAEVLPPGELSERLSELAVSEDGELSTAAKEYLGTEIRIGFDRKSSEPIGGSFRTDATIALLRRLGFEWPVVGAEYFSVFDKVKLS